MERADPDPDPDPTTGKGVEEVPVLQLCPPWHLPSMSQALDHKIEELQRKT